MWESPFFWSSVLGVVAYACVVGGTDPAGRSPRELLKIAGIAVGLSASLLLVNWLFAAVAFRTTVWQLFDADIPGWKFRKTVYLFYTFVVCAGLCCLHALIGLVTAHVSKPSDPRH
jgi:hypothetical protein